MFRNICNILPLWKRNYIINIFAKNIKIIGSKACAMEFTYFTNLASAFPTCRKNICYEKRKMWYTEKYAI